MKIKIFLFYGMCIFASFEAGAEKTVVQRPSSSWRPSWSGIKSTLSTAVNVFQQAPVAARTTAAAIANYVPLKNLTVYTIESLEAYVPELEKNILEFQKENAAASKNVSEILHNTMGNLSKAQYIVSQHYLLPGIMEAVRSFISMFLLIGETTDIQKLFFRTIPLSFTLVEIMLLTTSFLDGIGSIFYEGFAQKSFDTTPIYTQLKMYEKQLNEFRALLTGLSFVFIKQVPPAEKAELFALLESNIKLPEKALSEDNKGVLKNLPELGKDILSVGSHILTQHIKQLSEKLPDIILKEVNPDEVKKGQFNIEEAFPFFKKDFGKQLKELQFHLDILSTTLRTNQIAFFEQPHKKLSEALAKMKNEAASDKETSSIPGLQKAESIGLMINAFYDFLKAFKEETNLEESALPHALKAVDIILKLSLENIKGLMMTSAIVFTSLLKYPEFNDRINTVAKKISNLLGIFHTNVVELGKEINASKKQKETLFRIALEKTLSSRKAPEINSAEEQASQARKAFEKLKALQNESSANVSQSKEIISHSPTPMPVPEKPIIKKEDNGFLNFIRSHIHNGFIQRLIRIFGMQSALAKLKQWYDGRHAKEIV